VLRARDMADCFQLLHFHLGSQITNIRQVKGAVSEAVRIYVELKRAGAGLQFMDVGGGLGIDYDGSQTDFESSVNYTLQEYANDVVYHIRTSATKRKCRTRRSSRRAGRAVAGVSQRAAVQRARHQRVRRGQLAAGSAGRGRAAAGRSSGNLQIVITKNLQESFHDAQQALDAALNLFSLGYLPLLQRSLAENYYWAICRRIQKMAGELDYFPEELEGLESLLSDTYFCNFSLFQSMPDSWAVKQLFPIMPIHRLDDPPTRHAVLGDISCDSDGKVDQFIDRRDVKKTLRLHGLNGRPYYLGAFLVGAYQEILGDLHNLFRRYECRSRDHRR
jgi:arginine decarboxylase